MSDYQRPANGVVPKLVSDLNLKRVRVETDDGPSIRVTGTFSGSSTDITPLTDALGVTTDTSNDPTLIGLTKSNNISIIRMEDITTDIGAHTVSIETNTGKSATSLGDKTDAAWSGSGGGSVIAILKSIYTKLQ